jgi:hypothetical protein
MAGLKGYIPALARLLGTTPAALYERQRALVRAGLIEAEEGRGPGSGVRATPKTVALLLIAELCTTVLGEVPQRTRALARAKPVMGKCHFTRADTFLSAFSAVLFSYGMADRVTEIVISRRDETAHIRYRNYLPASIEEATSSSTSSFIGKAKDGIRIQAVIETALLQKIASDVQAMVQEEGEA